MSFPRFFLLLCGLLVLKAVARADDVPPPWAYGFKEPPPPPGTAQVPAGRPAPIPPDLKKYGLPGTERTFTRAEITAFFGPADYFPEEHPVPPLIVARGKETTVWSCARCHYYNGQGRPENAGLAGLPVDYFIGQLLAFRHDERNTSDPRQRNMQLMIGFAKAMTDEEIRAAAEYFGAMTWKPWVRVVESDRAPKTMIAAGMYLQVPEGGDEPLGNRIVEVPEDASAVEIQRSPHTGFVAYVPVGSVRRGEELVKTGAGKTIACATCHGPELGGATLANLGGVPGLAGRSPSYLVRQLFDMKTGKRQGARTEPMKPVVANLTTDDMLAIAAYLAARTP